MEAATSLLIFTIEGIRIAVDLQFVERVVRAAALTAIPGAPDTVMGMLNLNGTPVPIVNLRKKLNLGDRELDTNDEIVIFKRGHALLGAVVDDVEDVKQVKNTDMTPVAREADLPHLIGTVNLLNGIVLVHNIENFLNAKEESQLANAIVRSFS